ncbi:hypothetical protein [Haliea sp.]|uniref:hypothetical protein n=1 Tax=Haliea sp. TaxID=1932666 RepID=UPI0025BF34D6|nr:hypothetical protein [Haliea sp.]
MSAIRSVVACVALLGSSLAFSAPITWSGAQNTAGAADVVVSGNLIEAVNAGPSNAGSVTVNGVVFANSAALLPQSTTINPLGGASTGDANYDLLLGRFDFGGGTSRSLNIGGGNLLSGMSYIVQVWYTDLRSCCSGRTMTFGDGLGNNVNLNASARGLGQFAVGQFTAGGASQTLSLASNGFGNVHITAYQVREVEPVSEVPVPGPLFLIGLGLMLMSARLRAKG